MKTIHIFLEDKQYEELIKVKCDMTWNEFVMLLINYESEEPKGGVK